MELLLVAPLGRDTDDRAPSTLLLCARLTPLTSMPDALLTVEGELLPKELLLAPPVDGDTLALLPKKSNWRLSVRAMSGGGEDAILRVDLLAADADEPFILDRSAARAEIEAEVRDGAAATSRGFRRGNPFAPPSWVASTSGRCELSVFRRVDVGNGVLVADLPSSAAALPGKGFENSFSWAKPGLAPPRIFLGATIGLDILFTAIPAASGAISTPTALLRP